jgi:ABC-type enterochelin transport system permease subunit
MHYSIHIDDYRLNVVTRDMITYYTDKCVDVLELVAQKTAKIVYVEDAKTTALAFFCSGFIYVATGLIPTKVFFGLFVLGLFTMPYFYEQYEEEVDLYVLIARDTCLQLIAKYVQLVRSQSIVLFENAKELGASLAVIAQEQLQRARQWPKDKTTDEVVKATLSN